MDSNIHILYDVASKNISFLTNYMYTNDYMKELYYQFLDEINDNQEFIMMSVCSFILFTVLGLSVYALYIFYTFTSFTIYSNNTNTNNTIIKSNIKKLVFKRGLYTDSVIELFNAII